MFRYIVFDTETPNFRNDSICSIGISVVEGGRITQERYDLVNPEAHFDSFNVQLHGIAPEMVKDAKIFPDVWEELAPLMASGVLIAHNAPFDLGVLSKLFYRYGIEKEADSYGCTVQMGRKFLPNASHHKLNTLCDLLQIPLNHHNAASDSHACAELLCYYLAMGFPVEEQIKKWDYHKNPPRRW